MRMKQGVSIPKSRLFASVSASVWRMTTRGVLPLPYFEPRSDARLPSFERPRSGELRTQKLKSHLVRTQRLNVLPLKPGVGQYMAIHATLTARDFFLVYFYISSPFTCTLFLNLSRFFLCWLWLTHGSC